MSVNRFLLSLIVASAAAGCGRGESPPATPANASPPGPASAPVAVASPESPHSERGDAHAALSPPQSVKSPVAERVYRPADDRPRHDDAELERLGIRKYASQRLVLYSDAEPSKVESFPDLVDALYADWVANFGELPPARDGSDFQITGYLMADSDRFAAAGLVPGHLPSVRHGLHRGREFWVRDQTYDYYRAHLLLHEATHCFMTALPASVGPVWYMEGMAEHFAAHRLASEGARFRILPGSMDETPGFDRIDLVQHEIASGRFKTLDAVIALRPDEFLDGKSYEWSWAACHFLDEHPRYRERFRELGEPRLRTRFAEEFERRLGPDAEQLRIDWALFAHALCYGYDLERAILEVVDGNEISADGVVQCSIASDRGWQSTGARVEAGKRYRLVADGTFTLASEPKPWVSDAGGISFDYAGGRPLGLLLAAVLADAPAAEDPAAGFVNPIRVGRESIVAAPTTGTLYLRINDHWNRLADNGGSLNVTIEPGND